MVSHEEAIRLLRELVELGGWIDERSEGQIDDALEDLGRPRLGHPARTEDLEELEEALQHGADAQSLGLIRQAVDNLRRQKQILEELGR
jgi:hypothetical protein